MHLTENDKELFYKLWFGLIQFTNTKFNIDPNIGPPVSSGGADANKVAPVRDRLWHEGSLIDEYLDANGAPIPEDEQKILLGWKKRVSGDFILLKHLARYSVFMDFRDDDPNLYGVVGLTSELSEMFPQAVMPVLVNATLLPFKGRIIYDSLLSAKSLRWLFLNFGYVSKSVRLEPQRTSWMNSRKQSGIHKFQAVFLSK